MVKPYLMFIFDLAIHTRVWFMSNFQKVWFPMFPSSICFKIIQSNISKDTGVINILCEVLDVKVFKISVSNNRGLPVCS